MDVRFQWDTDSGFGGGQNEIVHIDLGVPTSGTYTLTFNSQTTAAIQWDDNAAAVKAALELLSGVHVVTVTGTGTTADPFVITHTDPINSGRNVPDMTGTDSLDSTLIVTVNTQGSEGPPIGVLTLDDSSNGDEQVPGSDLGLAGPWFWRVAVVDRDDGAGTWSSAFTLNFVDPIDHNRYLALNANPGYAFDAATVGENQGDSPNYRILVWQDATGGDFTLTHDSNVTSALGFDATAVQVQDALELLASIGSVRVRKHTLASGVRGWDIEVRDPGHSAETITLQDAGLTGDTVGGLEVLVTGDDWGSEGTVGPDGDPIDFNRYLTTVLNAGYGFDPTDAPAGGWGPEGTIGPDGLNIDDARYLALFANVDTTQPCPSIEGLSSPQAEAGDTIIVSGWGLVSGDDPTDAWDAEVRLYESPSFAAPFVVMSTVTWEAAVLDTITTTVPGGASSGFVTVVHTTTPSCSGSNFIGLTVIQTPPDLRSGWWVEVWNLRNTTIEISPLIDVVSADFEHIANDIGQGEIILPANHPDLSDIIDRTANPPVQKLVKVYLHDRFAYSFIPDDSEDEYSEDGAREVRIYGAGQESQLEWGRVLWNDFPSQPAKSRVWLWGSDTNLTEWGDMEPKTIISNGGLEDAVPDPWVGVGTGTLNATTSEARTGVYSLKVTPAALDDGTEIAFSVQEGQQVYVDLWTKVNTIGGTYEVQILAVDPESELDPPADLILDSGTWVPATTGFTLRALDFVAAENLQCRVRVIQTAGSLIAWFIDDTDVFNDIDYGGLLSFNAVATLSRDQAADGEYSLKVAANAGGDVGFNGVEAFFNSTANQKYRFSVAVTGPVGDVVQFDVRLGGVLFNVQQVLTGLGTFDVMTLEGTAGPLSATERFTLRSKESAALTFFADTLKISPGEAAATPGTIVTDVHTAMVARLTLDFVTLDFSATLDSAGLPWPETLAFEAQPEWSMWDLLEKLVGLGYQVQYAPVNWVEGGDTGWEIQLFAPLNGGIDWSLVEDGPAILPGDTVVDADASGAPPASTVVYGEGESGLWTVAQLSAGDITALERREEFVTNRSMKDTTALFRALTHRLDVTESRGEQFTADLTDQGDPLPYFNLKPLDRIRAHLPQGKDERDVVPDDVYRVATIAARLDGGGRQQAFQGDFGRYQLHKERIQQLLFNRLLKRSTTENYQPGTGSVSEGGSTGSSATSSAVESGGEVSAHSHGWPDVQPIQTGGDLGGTMPNPAVLGWRGRLLSAGAPADGEGYFFDTVSGLFKLGPGGGGGGDGTIGELGEDIATGTVTELEVSAIPSTGKDLTVVALLRSDDTAEFDDLHINVGNGTIDTGSNYRWFRVFDGSTEGLSSSESDTKLDTSGSVSGANADAGNFATLELTVYDYKDTTRQKFFRWTIQHYRATAFYTMEGWGRWESNSAIDVIRLTPNNGDWVADSFMRVYSKAGGAAPGAWVTPTLLNSWVDFGSGWSSAEYRKDSTGMVHVHGLIKDGTTAVSTVLFTFPTGHRPLNQIMFPSISNNLFVGLEILANGDVRIRTSGASNAYLSLDPISFLADGS